MAGKMRILGTGKLQQHIATTGSAEAGAVAAWYAEVAAASWRSPVDLRSRFPNAEFSPPDFVLFHLDTAAHCAAVRVNYDMQLMLVTFLGKRDAVRWPPSPSRARRGRI